MWLISQPSLLSQSIAGCFHQDGDKFTRIATHHNHPIYWWNPFVHTYTLPKTKNRNQIPKQRFDCNIIIFLLGNPTSKIVLNKAYHIMHNTSQGNTENGISYFLYFHIFTCSIASTTLPLLIPSEYKENHIPDVKSDQSLRWWKFKSYMSISRLNNLQLLKW